MAGSTVNSPPSARAILLTTRLLRLTRATFAFARALSDCIASRLDAGAFVAKALPFTRTLTTVEAGGSDNFSSSYAPLRADIWAAPRAL